MRYLKRKADEAVDAVAEEVRDEQRLRESVRLRQRQLEDRLRFVSAQSQVVRRRPT